ncbi:unnamed protein product, partial [Nippostrongylus brasiliensis]|uniref:VWFA domain-containing protein n=1 Tax=Nippostrongylus brasiliensis TaxID=27835 RepID=A0A0N4XPS1_NIPBR
ACELNVLIVLDRSDSVKGGFNKSRKFVTDVSEELQIGPLKHRVAMIVYSGLNYRREIFQWNFAKSNEEFVRITNNLRAIGGTTNTKKALEVANDILARRNKTIPTLVMVVTDGRSADDPKVPAQIIRKEPNVWMFAAATGDPEKVDKCVLELAFLTLFDPWRLHLLSKSSQRMKTLWNKIFKFNAIADMWNKKGSSGYEKTRICAAAAPQFIVV